MRRTRWWTAGLAAVAVAGLAFAVVPGGSASAVARHQTVTGVPVRDAATKATSATGVVAYGVSVDLSSTTPQWTTPMRITRPGGCRLYPALYKTAQPIAGHEWHRSHGYRLGWRYRVNRKWTMVLDYNRGDLQHRPRWAFIETSCLTGNKYPAGAKDGHGQVRSLWGRSSHGWRHVRFGLSRLAGVHAIGVRRVTVVYTTVRDNPRAFAIGNLFVNERFRITSKCTSHHNGPHGESPWVYGLDLQSRRWGWVPSAALHGKPCLKH
jgi:hypothetical protein